MSFGGFYIILHHFVFLSVFLIRIGTVVALKGIPVSSSTVSAPTPEYEICILISVEEGTVGGGASSFDIYSTLEDFESYSFDCETVVFHRNGTHEHCFNCPGHAPSERTFFESQHNHGGDISIISAKLKISTKLLNDQGGFSISQKTSATCRQNMTGETEFHISNEEGNNLTGANCDAGCCGSTCLFECEFASAGSSSSTVGVIISRLQK